MNSNQVLTLYRSLLRESYKFSSYNFREYSLRRITQGFRENKNIQDNEKLSQLYKEAQNDLQVIKRQAVINSMYSTQKLVVE
ncbi:hypothetical protein CYY_002925 [Polysphondylium violaceum]|uniref:Complex 1 LYR protein domain-containing protein n=1 Tax=Polysphondylium violaceum TaxID=133409 RepID=A0A8J4Q0I7_9MYCE|nr:hypothetical protein CYY_002925 [Polysphondylium violaceum]